MATTEFQLAKLLEAQALIIKAIEELGSFTEDHDDTEVQDLLEELDGLDTTFRLDHIIFKLKNVEN